MFTGIIEEVGEIVEASGAGEFQTIRVRAGVTLEDVRIGSSLAVNGVCVTVRSFDQRSFTAELSRETLSRTSFRNLAGGTAVNLERPMKADGRFGGHIVQGHVDAVGGIRRFDRVGDNWILEVEFPEYAWRYVVEKGSIAVDGISLTVAGVKPFAFSVAIIPHTFENTNLRRAKPEDPVNLEFDVI